MRAAVERAVLRHRAGAALCDAAWLLAAGCIAFVFLTGGASFTVLGHVVRMTSAGNPAAALIAIGLLRHALLPGIPLLGVVRLPASMSLDHLATQFRAWVVDASHEDRVRVPVAVIVSVTLGLRLIGAWAHPGFITGDDVEIHEMTLGHLTGAHWAVWNLRSAFYPMLFVYPSQWVASAIGVTDVRGLVFAGRLPVVVLSSFTMWGVYALTRRLSGSRHVAVLALLLVAASRLTLWFGSSELPRPVAAIFVLAGCLLLLLEAGTWRTMAAGVLLGVAGSLRFGELIFLAPAVVQMWHERRRRDAVVVLTTGLVTAGLCVGIADWLYWGRPFFSLEQIVRYTLVERQSSRGFQSPVFYLAHLTDWTNPVVAILAVLGLAANRRIAVWAWLPLLALSVLPHKEARYLIAVYPFVCVQAALGLQTWAGGRWPAGRWPVRRPAVVLLTLVVSIAYETANWRVPRTDDAVRLARTVADLGPHGVAAEQLWRFGGQLYFRGIDGPVVDISGNPLSRATIDDGRPEVVLLRRASVSAAARELTARGYRLSPMLETADYVAFVRE